MVLDHNYYELFARDQRRLRHNLKMNYGGRYDVESGLSKQINPPALQRHPAPDWLCLFAPDSKTVIRTEFGIFDDRYNLSFLLNAQPERPVIIPGETLPGIRKGANTATSVLNQITPGPLGLPSQVAATVVTAERGPKRDRYQVEITLVSEKCTLVR